MPTEKTEASQDGKKLFDATRPFAEESAPQMARSGSLLAGIAQPDTRSRHRGCCVVSSMCFRASRTLWTNSSTCFSSMNGDSMYDFNATIGSP